MTRILSVLPGADLEVVRRKLTHFPVAMHPDGRRAQVSDGVHTPADKAAGRSGRVHRGHDVMYRKPKSSAPRHPYSSKWYEIPEDCPTPALAAGDGVVFRIGALDTGWHVILDHGDGVGTAYHHGELSLSPRFGLRVGAQVRGGQPLMVVGGSPIGYGLVHLHFDTAMRGHFFDCSVLMAKWKHVPFEEAWESAGGTASHIDPHAAMPGYEP